MHSLQCEHLRTKKHKDTVNRVIMGKIQVYVPQKSMVPQNIYRY